MSIRLGPCFSAIKSTSCEADKENFFPRLPKSKEAKSLIVRTTICANSR